MTVTSHNWTCIVTDMAFLFYFFFSVLQCTQTTILLLKTHMRLHTKPPNTSKLEVSQESHSMSVHHIDPPVGDVKLPTLTANEGSVFV